MTATVGFTTPPGSGGDGSNSDAALLRERLDKLEAELRERNQYVNRLEKANRDMEQRLREAGETSQPTAELDELEEALKRLVARIAMILQAEKCVFMVHDPDDDLLFAEKPALGVSDEDLKQLKVRVNQGVSGEAFRENRPIIVYDAQADDRTIKEQVNRLGIRNGVCVPLIVEKRDDETNRVTDRRTIGVLHVFNKRYGNIFIEEDVHLLERLARNAAAIINTAETYRRVVHEKEELVETINSLYAGLLVVNKNGRITQMNQSARQIFGLAPEDLTGGKTFDQIIKDEKVCDILRRALEEEASGAGVAEEVTLPEPENPEQQHTFQVQSALVRNESGDSIGTAAIFNDITELKNVDKMKTAFVSTVSHELRTPLTSIKGFISTLVQDVEGFYDTETRQEFYTIIDTECDRLRRLIDDLLNVSRIESGKALSMNIAEFDVRPIVEKVNRTQGASTYKKSSHTLSFELDPKIPEKIQADEDKVEQIFNNLVSNALKYSPKGGNIKVTGKMMSDELIQFGVSDQGMGIPKEHLGKMFARFHRVDNRDTREIGGTGIGLFLVKALVEMHGGKIWIESEVGKGSTFWFTLPTTQPEEAEEGELAKRVAG
jgi:two-component system phosphate regulon sensor histidine kinase PhoR